MRVNRGLLAGALLFCCIPMMAGCSFKETLSVLWNGDEGKKEDDDSSSAKLEGFIVDESVEKPVLNSELGEAVTYDLNAQAEPLVMEASVSDGGVLSYQWYRNNVDSNGGGTAIEGATENTFTPPTDVPGITYYYVVVTNTVGNKIQLVTSSTKCVSVSETEGILQAEPADETAEDASQDTAAAGSWVQDENGWYYQRADGSRPVAQWENIEGENYAFDENGYRRTGWYQEGDARYYLDENGKMLHDTDVEGVHLGSNGAAES